MESETTSKENGTEPSQNNEILEPDTRSNSKEKTGDPHSNSDNNDSNDVPSVDLNNDQDKMEEEDSTRIVNNNKDKSNDGSIDSTETPVENGLGNDDVDTNDESKETEDEKQGSVCQPNSQNDDVDEDDDDFNPLLLCPDISMDVDESPVMTSGDTESGAANSTEMLDSNALFAPLFSTFVDEMTGAEISFNLTAEEQQLREKLYGPNNPIEYSKIHCTACNVHLGSALAGQTNRFVHPLLKVLICKECYHFYTSGEFEKDEDGSELYCRWCGQGGQVLCCTMCEFVFCKKCIRINFGRKKLTEVRDSDDWKCFRCDPSQLKALRAMCVEFFEYVRKATAVAAASSDPDHINKDLTNCCQSQQKRKAVETEAEKKEETPSRRSKKRKNDEDPDYNPFARQDSPEPPPPMAVASTSGSSVASTSGTPVTLRPMPTLIPKPTLNEVSFPGKSPSPTVRIGNTVLNVKSAPPSIAAAIQARNAQNFAARSQNTAIRSVTANLTIRAKSNFVMRTPTQDRKMDAARCLKLIELYKERCFLWNSEDAMFHSKKKRKDAWGEISKLMKIPAPELKARMKTLMGTYRSEKSKERKGIITGSGSRDKYTSKWYAFKSFGFLMNRDQPRGRVDTDMNQADEEATLTPEIVNDNRPSLSTSIPKDERATEETGATTTQTTTTSQRAALKRKRELRGDDQLMKTFRLLKSSAAISQEPCHAYGIYIANELKKFDQKTRACIKKGIADVFFKAEMGLFLPALRPVLVSPSAQDNSPSGSSMRWSWDEEYNRQNYTNR